MTAPKTGYPSIDEVTGFGLYDHVQIPPGSFVVHHYATNHCLAVERDGCMREITGPREAVVWLRLRHIAREVRNHALESEAASALLREVQPRKER